MKKVLFSLCLSGFLLANAQQKTAVKPAPSPSEKKTVPINSFIDSVSYCYGISLGEFLKSQKVSKINYQLVSLAAQQAVEGQTQIDPQKAAEIIQRFSESNSKKISNMQKEIGEKFLSQNKVKAGVKTTASGLQYEVITEGKGVIPTKTDSVTVHYVGTLLDGTEFDNSRKRNQPLTIPVAGVIPGWTEAMQLMPTGSKWKLWIPSNLAYGDRGAGQQIPGGSTLFFEVELLEAKPAK